MIFNVPGTPIQIDIAPELLQELIGWAVFGAPHPSPDIIKKMTLVQYAKAFGAASFIETGTFLGTTTWLMAHYGLQCKTIELAQHHYDNAVRTLGGYPNVELFLGDSSDHLSTMVSRAPAPHLFWLDGHYSRGTTARGRVDTPIMQELEQLTEHDLSRSVIMIDDMRDFGAGDYPPVAEVVRFAANHWPNHVCENYGDILRITPKVALRDKLAEGAALAA